MLTKHAYNVTYMNRKPTVVALFFLLLFTLRTPTYAFSTFVYFYSMHPNIMSFV